MTLHLHLQKLSQLNKYHHNLYNHVDKATLCRGQKCRKRSFDFTKQRFEGASQRSSVMLICFPSATVFTHFHLEVFVMALFLEVVSAGLQGVLARTNDSVIQCPKWVSYFQAHNNGAQVWVSILPTGHLPSPGFTVLAFAPCFLVNLKLCCKDFQPGRNGGCLGFELQGTRISTWVQETQVKITLLLDTFPRTPGDGESYTEIFMKSQDIRTQPLSQIIGYLRTKSQK